MGWNGDNGEIRSKAPTDKYREGFDAIDWSKKSEPYKEPAFATDALKSVGTQTVGQIEVKRMIVKCDICFEDHETSECSFFDAKP